MTLDETIDRLVADALVRPWPALTPRRIALPALPGKADAVIGPRRAGKTWLLFQHAQALEARGVARRRILYVNFEDERLGAMTAEGLDLFPSALYRRHPDVLDGERWFLLDEVQVVPGWERFVRRMLDRAGTHVVVTGSSARLLGREIATSLRGRSLATEVLPFDFVESAAHAGVAVPDRWPPPERARAELRHHLDRYLGGGGFPEVQGLDAELRARVLRDLVDVALLRDVVERHGVTNLPGLRALVRRLLSVPRGRFSVHRFHNELRSQGLAVAKDSLHAWLGHLEDAFLVFLVPIHSRSESVKRSNPRKVYPVDPALPPVPASQDIGHRLEVAVYLELRRRGLAVAWVDNADGTEVDFLAEDIHGSRSLIQVCATLAEPVTREREMHALEAAMRERGIPEGTVVTLGEAGKVDSPAGPIRITPAWDWLAGRAGTGGA